MPRAHLPARTVRRASRSLLNLLALFVPLSPLCTAAGCGDPRGAPPPAPPAASTVTAAAPTNLHPVALPLEGAPFPGYYGRERCTLVAPLAWRELGLAGPTFQCGSDRFMSVRPDATLQADVTITVSEQTVTPPQLHFAVRRGHGVPAVWVGDQLVRGVAGGLERWTPPTPSAGEAFGTGLPEGAPVTLSVADGQLWVLTREAVYRAALGPNPPQLTRFLALASLVTPEIPAVSGEYVRIVPVREDTILLRFSNYGANNLYLVTEAGARPLAVPEGPGAERPSGHGRAGGPGGGATAPRTSQIQRVGERVIVATADDRLLRLDGEALTPLSVQPPLRWYATQNFEGDGTAAAAEDGTLVLLLGDWPYLCRADRCDALPRDPAADPHTSTSYGLVEHIAGPHFLLLSTGASVWDTSP